ncbi:PDZ domain-containing protein [Bacillus sp. 2205SS5-2]|uniref:PDZ domain-containing protein n=1 Tax=Bacillus sp. 2205SS5-2 TaxID=3109031 RepID=UPI003004A3DB
MIEQWAMELGRAVVKLFLHPLLYVSIIAVLFTGYFRIRRERKDFHVRVYDMYQELRNLLPLGLGLGMIFSVIIIGTGLAIPFSAIVLIGFVTMILLLFTSFRLLSPAYSVGISYLILSIMDYFEWEFSFLNITVSGLDLEELLPLTLLIGLLILVEGLFILINSAKKTSPTFIKSPRGLTVGAHVSRRLWLLPLFILIPGDALSLPFQWWPVLSVGDQTFSILLVPFLIGFHQKVQSMLPKRAIGQMGKKVIWLGGLVTIFAASGYFAAILSVVSVLTAIIGREWITMKQRTAEENRPYLFSPQEKGVRVLGIIPLSPADKMGLVIGEIIEKVNGIVVRDERTFYEALQKNRAYCKLEVLDVNQQIRFVQGALYEGDHHELGILFPVDDARWNLEQRA